MLPVPFGVRVFSLPDLFAAKMHALLFRRWQSRVKGHDWYDLVWDIARHPQLRLSHLESRMRHGGHWTGDSPLTRGDLLERLSAAIADLDVKQARQEADRYVKDKSSLDLWSRDFFLEIVERIETL